jgi:hypothetical protein
MQEETYQEQNTSWDWGIPAQEVGRLLRRGAVSFQTYRRELC